MQLTSLNNQRGAALVEFAVVLPLALVFLFGIIEFGLAMFQYHATDYAAKYAARYASVRGADCSASDCPITGTTLQTAVRNAVPGAGAAVVSPTWTSPPVGTYPGSSVSKDCDKTDENKGCFVIVTVTNHVALSIPFFPTKPLTFTASATAPISQ